MSEIGEIVGCGSTAEAQWIREECERLLGADEVVECAARLHDNVILFTDWRLLLVVKDRLGSKKVEYTSIPYRAVVRFTVEAVGMLDLDAEVRIWTSSQDDPIRLQFSRAVNVYDFQVKLAKRVAGHHLRTR
jgi:hypothetical protein